MEGSASKLLVSSLVSYPVTTCGLQPEIRDIDMHLPTEQGAKVTAHYNSNINTLKSLIAEFGAQTVQALQADLSIEGDVVRLFSQASTSFGPVQSIIVNHGVWPTADQPVVKMSLDQWKSTIDTNLTSSFLVSREYLRNLESASDALKTYASIIFVGSTAGKFGE